MNLSCSTFTCTQQCSCSTFVYSVKMASLTICYATYSIIVSTSILLCISYACNHSCYLFMYSCLLFSCSAPLLACLNGRLNDCKSCRANYQFRFVLRSHNILNSDCENFYSSITYASMIKKDKVVSANSFCKFLLTDSRTC